MAHCTSKNKICIGFAHAWEFTWEPVKIGTKVQVYSTKLQRVKPYVQEMAVLGHLKTGLCKKEENDTFSFLLKNLE